MTRQEYLENLKAITEDLRKQSVKSVLVSSSSVGSGKDTFLNDRQRARTVEVKAMLARGENPFEHIASLTIGENHHERVIRDLSPERIKELEDKWKGKNLPSTLPTRYLEEDDPDLTPFKVENDPLKLVCSYCGVEVGETSATRGTGQTRVSKLIEVETIGDEPQVVEKVVVRAKKLIACPDCSLNIKKGSKRFPETEG